MTTNTNTTSALWLAASRADELGGLLAGFLDWLCAGDPAALDDFEAHLAQHATVHGGIFAAEEFTNGAESILDTFTWLIDAYHTIVDLDDDQR
jgi:hypothetical protein